MAGINNKEVMKRLGELMEELNLRSVRSFALAIDTDPSHFAKVYKGERAISKEIAKNIHQKYNVSEAWIMYGRGEKYAQLAKGKIPAQSKNFSGDLNEIISRQQEEIMLLRAAMEVYGEKFAEINLNTKGGAISKFLTDLENEIKDRYRMRFDEWNQKP